MSPRWQPQVIFLSGVTDCYQPVEARLKLMRRCLAVLAEFRNPVFIITKNRLVTRDADVLSELARHQAAAVWLSITTLDAGLRRIMEPRTSPPEGRLAAIRELAQAGIPVGVNVAPVIPGLTDHEIPAILQAAADAGATAAGHSLVRLPYAVAPLFEQWLATHFPDRKEKVLNRLRAMRGGKLNDSRWGTRMSGEGIFADQIEQMFEVARRKTGIPHCNNELSTAAFRRPPGAQLSLSAA
jgi:DNA repair photolyase